MIGGYKFLMWIGIVVLVLPFIGVPVLWKEIVLFLVGILTVAQAVFLRDISNKNTDA